MAVFNDQLCETIKEYRDISGNVNMGNVNMGKIWVNLVGTLRQPVNWACKCSKCKYTTDKG